MDAKNFLRSIEREAIVAYTDIKGRIEYVNEKFCEISGYSREELVGQDHRIVNSGYHSKDFFTKMWETIHAGDVWVGEICNRSKSGELYWVNTTISPSVVDGKVAGFYAVRHDITRIKALEKENEEMRKLSDAIQKVGKIGGWSTNLETDELIVTNEIKTIFGVPLDLKLTYQEFDELIPHEEKSSLSKLRELVIENRTEQEVIVKAITLKGIVKWIKITAVPLLNKHDTLYKIIGTLQDVSALKKAEQKAEFERQKNIHGAKLASIGEMSSSVIHEMKNPLTILQADLRMIKRSKSFDDAKKVVDKMDKPIDKLLKLANNLRQYSRNEGGSKKAVKCRLSDIVKDSLDFVEHRLNYCNVALDTELSEEVIVSCVPSEVEQVLVNLINNAIDVVEVMKTRWVKIECFLDNQGNPTLTVTDSGDGIPKNIVDKIFDSFFTTKPPEKGTGLGLGIVKDILGRYGASIRVDQDCPNTRFRISFPPA